MAKAVICFCLLLTVTCLTAQNTGSYKYIIYPAADTSYSGNSDMLVVDNHY
jgi:hypothetical protein